MITLKDGPAKGTYTVKRAPLYLRAVVKDRGTKRGELDVLNEPADVPGDDEAVSVYRRVSTVSLFRICGRGISGQYAVADYEHMPDVDGERLRLRESWIKWWFARRDDPREGAFEAPP